MIPLNLPQRSHIQGLWHLNEESGVRADESGNGNTLTDVNTVLSGTAKIGAYAGAFVRVQDECLYITNAAQTGLGVTGEISFTCWLNLETLPSSVVDDFYIIAKWGGAGSSSYYFRILKADNKPAFALSHDGTNATVVIADTALATGSYIHLGFTLNQVDDKIRIYRNGLLDCTPVAYTQNIFDSTADFVIGAANSAGGGGHDGLEDEPIIWNICLTPAEVLQGKNITAYRYGGRFMPFFMSMREAYERHDKLWTPKGILIPEGI